MRQRIRGKTYLRGYIGLPEENERHWKGDMFHTGDSGLRDELGRLCVHGRLDDKEETISRFFEAYKNHLIRIVLGETDS